jgi:hypothetical protein
MNGFWFSLYVVAFPLSFALALWAGKKRRLLFALFIVIAVPLSIALAFLSEAIAIYLGLLPTLGFLMAGRVFLGHPYVLQVMILVDTCFWFVLLVGTAMFGRARRRKKNPPGGNRS